MNPKEPVNIFQIMGCPMFFANFLIQIKYIFLNTKNEFNK